MKKNRREYCMARRIFILTSLKRKTNQLSILIMFHYVIFLQKLRAVCPCPGAIYMYKIMKKKIYIHAYKIGLQRDILKLATNN